MEHQFGGTTVEVVLRSNVKHIAIGCGNRCHKPVRPTLGGHEADIGHELSLPEHVLTPCDILVPRLGLLPPRQRTVEYGPDEQERQARHTIRPRLHDPFAEAETIYSGAKRPVAQRLQRCGMVEKIAAPPGESLCTEDAVAIDMGCGSHLLDDVAQRKPRITATLPELAHRFVGTPGVTQIVACAIIRLNRKSETLLVAELLHFSSVVLQKHFTDGLAVVPQKPFRHFQAVDHQSVKCGQVRRQVITASATELVPKAGGPVSRTRFPTVDVG